MTRQDAHRYIRRIDLFFNKLEKNELVPEGDKKLLREFSDYLASEGISYGRINKHLYDMKRVSELLGKRYAEADEQDIRKLVVTFDRNENLSPWSRRDFKMSMRKFFTWLRGTKEYPPEVAWMKVYGKIKNTRNAEDMLTEEEVKKLIDAAETPQAKAFVATLYESGCRIGEMFFLKIGQVKFDEYGAQLFVTGKTGFRRVRVIAAVPYLADWMNRHPRKTDPEANLWLNYWLKPFSYGGISGMLHRISRKAGINKRMNPHNFRHSRATNLANFLTDAQMKEHFGWAQDSKMAAVYIHLSGRDVDKALLKVYGMEIAGDKKDSVLKPKTCGRCRQENQATSRFCARCGLPLDEQAKAEVMKKDMERKEADGVLDKLIEDGEFRDILLKKIRALSSKNNQTANSCLSM